MDSPPPASPAGAAGPLGPSPGQRRPRAARLIGLAAVIVVLLVWQSQRTGHLQVHVHLGARGAQVARLELVWRDAATGDVVFDSSFRLDTPREDLYQRIPARPGAYDVAVRLVLRDGREELSSVRVTAEKDRPASIDLAAAAPPGGGQR